MNGLTLAIFLHFTELLLKTVGQIQKYYACCCTVKFIADFQNYKLSAILVSGR